MFRWEVQTKKITAGWVVTPTTLRTKGPACTQSWRRAAALVALWTEITPWTCPGSTPSCRPAPRPWTWTSSRRGWSSSTRTPNPRHLHNKSLTRAKWRGLDDSHSTSSVDTEHLCGVDLYVKRGYWRLVWCTLELSNDALDLHRKAANASQRLLCFRGGVLKFFFGGMLHYTNVIFVWDYVYMILKDSLWFS